MIKLRKNENICKFVDDSNANEIKILNFVFEKSSIENQNNETRNCNTINIVTNGKGKLIISGKENVLQQGDVFFTFKQIPYCILNTDNLEYMYISFEGTRSEDLFMRFGVSPANCIFTGHEKLSAFWQSSIIKAGEKNLDLISESVLLYTFGEMAPNGKNDEQHLLGNLVKFIDENFNDSNLNLNSAAEAFGYNSKYISRVFKNSMGITFSEYLTNARMQHAVFLIEQNVTSVKNIALLSGYKDPLYFSNVFKNKIGTSPKEYINKKQSD